MSDELIITPSALGTGKLTIEPPLPEAVTLWSQKTQQHLEQESEALLLIRDLQRRVHRLEQLLRAYGCKIVEEQCSVEPNKSS